jgi:hypothetical protein
LSGNSELSTGNHGRPANEERASHEHATDDHAEGALTDGALTDGVDPDAANDEVDDQFRSLLEGLRTSLPGVQVLFAFLLTVPLQGAFADFDSSERAGFTVAFFSSGLASILLIAPSVHQRMRAPLTGIRRHSKAHLRISTWVTIAGTVAMGVAVATTIFLVTELLFGNLAASGAAAAISGLVVWSWFYLPLVTFVRIDRQAAPAG